MKRTKVAIVAAGIALMAGMTACTAPEFSNYSGTVTIKNTAPSKYTCSVTVELEDGSSKLLNLGPAGNCYGLVWGQKVEVQNGKLIK